MTKRCVILLILVLPIAGIAAFISNNTALTVFIILNALILGFYGADMFISPRSDVLDIKRSPEDKLYFKAENDICFTVKNNFTRTLNIEIKDAVPDWHFDVISENMKFKVAPGKESRFYYTVIPGKRGSFLFPDIFVRYDGVLGMCKKYFTVRSPMDYKVYPNLRNLSKYRLIIQKHRLLTNGQRRIPIRGLGSEFESLRDYVEGDDYRKVNWMATARENKLIINQFEAEKNQPVYMLLDSGRAMSYSIKGYKKLDYSINAALVLSDIVNQKGDNSGLMVFNTDVKALIPPGKGEAHRRKLMEALYHIEDTNMPSDYASAFYELINTQKRRSIVFIFTDFETTEEAQELILSVPIIAKRHVPVIILMVNESLEMLTRNTSTDTKGLFNEAMAESLIMERKKIIRALNQRGIMCVES
ncbi:MAG: DUF58 domain-containing protein, partial [Clostridiales bacterium]|nr:DUF58 domain-containing protein [Clostridiales bacterium]